MPAVFLPPFHSVIRALAVLLIIWAAGGTQAQTHVVALGSREALNLFSAPSTDFAIVETLPGGAFVEPLEEWGDWVRIETGYGAWGWAVRAALRPVLDPAEWREVADPRDPELNLRAGPGTGFEILYKMPNESRVFVLAAEGNWRFVRHESGNTGWAWGPSLAEPRPMPPVSLPRLSGGGN